MNYKLDEAQAIMNELRAIRKAICMGERERQDLLLVRCYLLVNSDLLLGIYIESLLWYRLMSPLLAIPYVVYLYGVKCLMHFLW